jgi:FixJ family two-component response regulator
MRVECFASPRELLERGHPLEVSCLLLDVQLPGMSGFELHDRLLAAGLQAPVIFVTGHPGEEARARAREAEAVALLEKPVDDRDLSAAINRALLWNLARKGGGGGAERASRGARGKREGKEPLKRSARPRARRHEPS